MKDFIRKDQIFSLCGLNCSLCLMYFGHYCPGCGGGEGNQPCAIARCSRNHGNIEYCFLCKEYPCSQYEDIELYDSFITHRNQKKDMERAARIGLEAYHREQREKAEILNHLLTHYNDGRHKSFFSLAVNLLEVSALSEIIIALDEDTKNSGLSAKEKAKAAETSLKAHAKSSDVVLKQNKKKI